MYQWYITNAHQKNIAIPIYTMAQNISQGSASPSVRIDGKICGDVMNCILFKSAIYVLIRWREEMLKYSKGKELKAYFSVYKLLATSESPLAKKK